MTPPAPPGQQHHHGGRGLNAWIHAHQGEAAAIGIGGALALAFLIRRMSSGGSNSSAATPNSTTGTESAGVAYGYGDSGAGYYTSDSQYAEQQAALDSFLNAYTQGTLGSQLFPNGSPLPTSSPPASKPPATKVGNPNPITKGSALIPAQKITVPVNASLLSLSQKYLGTSNRTVLAHANGLGTGAGLRTGQTLVIPAHYS
jgi:hypothetical protein